MKIIKKKYLSLCIATFIVVSSSVTYPGFLSWWPFGHSVKPKYSFLKLAARTGEYTLLVAGVVTTLAALYKGISHLFDNTDNDGSGTSNVTTPKISQTNSTKLNKCKKKKPTKQVESNVSAIDIQLSDDESNVESSGVSNVTTPENSQTNGVELSECKKKKPTEQAECSVSAIDTQLSGDESSNDEVVIPGYLRPYVVKAKRYRGINYFHLKTVDQSRGEVKGVVSKKEAGGICPALSIRNAGLLYSFLSRNGQEARGYLGKMKNRQSARNYLKRLVDRGTLTSWLQAEQVERLLRGLKIKNSNIRFSDIVTVVDPALIFNYEQNPGFFSTEQIEEIERLRNDFSNRESYFHLFIINTGDLSDPCQFMSVLGNIEREHNCKFNAELTKRVSEYLCSCSHYYTLALQKKDNQVNCYVVDSQKGNKHIDIMQDRENYCRNRYICESLLYRNYECDYPEEIKRHAREVLMLYLPDERKRNRKRKKKKRRKATAKNIL